MNACVAKIAVTVMLVIFEPLLLSATKEARPGSPKWGVDLSKDNDFHARISSPKLQSMERPGIRYLSADTAVVIFNDNFHWIPPSPVLRAPASGARTFRFHAIFIEPANGSVKGKLSWPTRHEHSNIVPLGGGSFLVLAGETLLRYSPALEVLQELDVAVEFAWDEVDKSVGRTAAGSVLDYWSMDITQDKKTVALAHVHGRGGTTFTLLEAATLRRIGRIEADGFGDYSVADKLVARPHWYSTEILSPVQERRVWTRPFKSNQVLFLDNKHLAVAVREEIILADLNGDALDRKPVPTPINVFSAAASNPSFAIGATETRNGQWQFVVQVFQWKPLRRVFQKAFSKHATKKGWDIGFNHASIALSPDGSQLLVLRDSLLELHLVN